MSLLVPPTRAIPAFARPRGSRHWLSYRVGAAETQGCPWAAGQAGGGPRWGSGLPCSPQWDGWGRCGRTEANVGGRRARTSRGPQTPAPPGPDPVWRLQKSRASAHDPPGSALPSAHGPRHVPRLMQPGTVKTQQCTGQAATLVSDDPHEQRRVSRGDRVTEEGLTGKGRMATVERVSSKTNLRRRGQASQMMGRRVSPCVLHLSTNR